MSNAFHAQILGKFVLLLLCSKGVKILVIYQHISDWSKEKIGIGKCKNMHIGATLIKNVVYPYRAFPFWYGMYSRDTTAFVDLLWFNVVHCSSLFQYFFSIYYDPYSNWKFLYLFRGTALLLPLNQCIPHQNNNIVCPKYIIWKENAPLPAMFNLLYQ